MSSSANVLSNIFNLTKKNILITGGSSGLGEHFAYLMASAGAPNIVLAARRKEKLDKVQSEISTKYPSCKIITVSLDVTDRKSISLAFNEAESQIGTTINCLINNAGIANPKLSLELEEDDWDGLRASITAEMKGRRGSLYIYKYKSIAVIKKSDDYASVTFDIELVNEEREPAMMLDLYNLINRYHDKAYRLKFTSNMHVFRC